MRISKIEKILNVIVIELVIFLVGKIFSGGIYFNTNNGGSI